VILRVTRWAIFKGRWCNKFKPASDGSYFDGTILASGGNQTDQVRPCLVVLGPFRTVPVGNGRTCRNGCCQFGIILLLTNTLKKISPLSLKKKFFYTGGQKWNEFFRIATSEKKKDIFTSGIKYSYTGHRSPPPCLPEPLT